MEEDVYGSIADLPGVVRVERTIDGAADELLMDVRYIGTLEFLGSMITDELRRRLPDLSGDPTVAHEKKGELVYVLK